MELRLSISLDSVNFGHFVLVNQFLNKRKQELCNTLALTSFRSSDTKSQKTVFLNQSNGYVLFETANKFRGKLRKYSLSKFDTFAFLATFEPSFLHNESKTRKSASLQ